MQEAARRKRRWRARASPPTLMGSGFALLLLAWVLSTVPFNAPDEASHYLRALSITNGHLLGARAQYSVPGLSPAQARFASSHTRTVFVAPGLSPPNVACRDGERDIRGCVELTSTGDYLPLPYVLPALALATTDHAETGLWLSRLATGLLCALFIAAGIVAVGDGLAWSRLGPLAALTPMALFVSSVMNPSGIEVAAVFAFYAAGLRLGRRADEDPPWIWGLAALAAAVAIMSWTLGPAFIAMGSAAAIALREPRSASAHSAGRRRRTMILAGVITSSVAVWGVYGYLSGASRATFSLSPIRSGLHQGLTQLGPVLRDAVGHFASLTIQLPAAVQAFWWLFVIAVVGAGFVLGRTRERLVLIGTVLAALLLPVVFYWWIYRFTGFGMQGRYVLPGLMLIPMTGGEIVHRHRVAPRTRGVDVLPRLTFVAVAVVQLYALWFNARANAGPHGAFRLFSPAAWAPPTGWLPWLILAGFGTLLLASSSERKDLTASA